MIVLRDKETGAEVGSISIEQLRFLIDQLEEEFDEDRDYYVNQTMLDVMDQKQAEPELVAMLRTAIGDREGIEIEWSRSD